MNGRQGGRSHLLDKSCEKEFRYLLLNDPEKVSALIDLMTDPRAVLGRCIYLTMSTQVGRFPGVRRVCTYSSIAEDDDSTRHEKQDDNCFERTRNPPSLWAPFFLRRPVMVGFLLTFIAILSSLLALFAYTERQNRGLGIETESRYYYLWTYGPTTGMCLVIWLSV